jgi:hypothetical protein
MWDIKSGTFVARLYTDGISHVFYWTEERSSSHHHSLNEIFNILRSIPHIRIGITMRINLNISTNGNRTARSKSGAGE